MTINFLNFILSNKACENIVFLKICNWDHEILGWCLTGSVLLHGEKVPLKPWLAMLLLMVSQYNIFLGRCLIASTSFTPLLFLLGWLKLICFGWDKTDCWKYPLTIWYLSSLGFLALICRSRRYRKMCSLVALWNLLLCVTHVILAI